MRTLVVYESMFGNTQAIAHAIADGLSLHHDVTLEEVGLAPERLDDDIVLLVVGGPTHALGMSRPETRADAAAQAGTSPTATPVATGSALGEPSWLSRRQDGLCVAHPALCRSRGRVLLRR